MGAAVDQILEDLGPLVSSPPTAAEIALVDAMFGGLDQYADVDELGDLLDPVLCPSWALDWLGQWTGAGDMSTLTEAQKRYRIDSLPAHARGRIATIVAAMQAQLTGAQTVFVQERYTGSPWKILLVTRTSETPDAAKALAAAQAALPAGYQITHTVVTGQTYAQAAVAAATYTTASGLWATYTAAANG